MGGQSDAPEEELFSSIAGGDMMPLSRVQTSHRIDLTISALTEKDRPSLLRLARWAQDADTAVARVNATGIIAKTHTDLVERVPVILAHDREARELYVSAVLARVGDDTDALASEVCNPRDAGARWCAARMLAQRGGRRADAAMLRALRVEPVRENVRAYALLLNGDDPCT